MTDDFEARRGIVPIEIRPGMFVRIAPIPHDLTEAEAEKIGRVVLALASDDTRRMAATGTGAGRSPSGAVDGGEAVSETPNCTGENGNAE